MRGVLQPNQPGADTDPRALRTLLRHGDSNARTVRAGLHPEKTMLHYAVVFFIIALVAAVFGFGGIAAGAVGIAKILFVVFLVLAALSFVANLMRRA